MSDFIPACFRPAPAPLAKSVESELARIEALLTSQEKPIRDAFLEFLRDARSERTMREIGDLLERGDLEAAIQILEQYIVRMGAVVPRVIQDAGRAEAASIAQTISRFAPVVAIGFDPTNPRAAALARVATLAFIQQFSDLQRAATRQALVQAMTEGLGTAATARAFRDSIGLTAYHLQVVANYRTQLERSSAAALDRALRDRRFDRSVRRAANGGEPLSKDQIDRMVERYQARMLAGRADTIARTETLGLVSQAREEAFRQSIEQAGIEPSRTDQSWRTTRDGRERPTHHEMDGQLRQLGEPFESPSGATLRYPGDPDAPAAEIIGCRCHVVYRIRAPMVAEAA